MFSMIIDSSINQNKQQVISTFPHTPAQHIKTYLIIIHIKQKTLINVPVFKVTGSCKGEPWMTLAAPASDWAQKLISVL